MQERRQQRLRALGLMRAMRGALTDTGGRSHRPRHQQRPIPVRRAAHRRPPQPSHPKGVLAAGGVKHPAAAKPLAGSRGRGRDVRLGRGTHRRTLVREQRGVITALVFPDRGGPSSSTARSGRESCQSPSCLIPRYRPPPSSRAPSRTTASGSSVLAIACVAQAFKAAGPRVTSRSSANSTSSPGTTATQNTRLLCDKKNQAPSSA